MYLDKVVILIQRFTRFTRSTLIYLKLLRTEKKLKVCEDENESSGSVQQALS
jgi:hypothetical protein